MRLLMQKPFRSLGALASRLLLLLCTCAALSLPSAHALQARAAERVASEDAVKAAYLYRLRNYVEWPAGAAKANEGLSTIGVVGADEVAEHLLEIPAVRNRTAGAAQIKRLRTGDSLAGISILYVSEAYWNRAQVLVAQAAARSILVVSESPLGLPPGSMINFRVVDERVRFDVSLDAAEKAGLKLKSQLLALALTVVRDKRP